MSAPPPSASAVASSSSSPRSSSYVGCALALALEHTRGARPHHTSRHLSHPSPIPLTPSPPLPAQLHRLLRVLTSSATRTSLRGPRDADLGRPFECAAQFPRNSGAIPAHPALALTALSIPPTVPHPTGSLRRGATWPHASCCRRPALGGVRRRRPRRRRRAVGVTPRRADEARGLKGGSTARWRRSASAAE